MEFNFAELAGFNGLTNEAGYVFTSRLTADTDIYSVSFSAAAIPATWAMMLPCLGAAER